MNIKVGNKLKIIKRNLNEDGRTDGVFWVNSHMDRYDGKIITVDNIMFETQSKRGISYGGWLFIWEWLELVKKPIDVRKLNKKLI